MLSLRSVEYIIIYSVIIINCKNYGSIIDSLIYLLLFIPFLCFKSNKDETINNKDEDINSNINNKRLLLPSILLIPVLFSIVGRYYSNVGSPLFFGCIAILFCHIYVDSIIYQVILFIICVLFQYIFFSVNMYYSICIIVNFHLFYYFFMYTNLKFPLDEVFTISFLLCFLLLVFFDEHIASHHITSIGVAIIKKEVELIATVIQFFVFIKWNREIIRISRFFIVQLLVCTKPYPLVFIVMVAFEVYYKEKYIYILAYWFCLIILMLIIHPTTDSTKIHNIIVRKFYHILTIILFLPIIFIDIDFMALSFAVSLYLFAFIELLRYENIYPFTLINNYIGSYIDERDMNRFVITPIYLLLGNSLPVYLAIYFSTNESNSYMRIMEYGGILTLGVEDTCV